MRQKAAMRGALRSERGGGAGEGIAFWVVSVALLASEMSFASRVCWRAYSYTRRACSPDWVQASEMFRACDENFDGALTPEEFAAKIGRLNIAATPDDIRRMMAVLQARAPKF